MTVGEMAEKLSQKFQCEKAPLVRQLRGWATEGLLTEKPIPREGTGKHRVFDWASLCRATVLFELSRYGLPIGQMKGAAHWLNRHRYQDFSKVHDPSVKKMLKDHGLVKKFDAFEEAVNGKPMAFVFCWSPDGRLMRGYWGFIFPGGDTSSIEQGGYYSYLKLSLNDLFEGVAGE